jgi:lactate dehydrogenase-like 2-hydroxyacid dehydrogenase
MRDGRMRQRVLVTRRLPAAVERAIAERFDATFDATDAPLDAASLAEGVRTHDAILATVTDRLTSAVLGASPRRVRIVANFGVGVNHVDLEAARAAGIVVTNTPDVLTDDTADLALALMLMAARGLGAGERLVRAGRWDGWGPTRLMGRSLRGKSLGIVGFGRIGQATARRAALGLGMRVLWWGPRTSAASEAAARELGAERAPSLEALLAASDVVSLHCPATPETRHLIGARELARMRPSAILVNTARGDVVDEAALAAALANGTIAAAGLDVYEQEPRVHPALVTMENVVLLPHLGSATEETRVAMGMRALANLEAFFAGAAPPDRVA